MTTRGNIVYTRVSELIDQETEQWDEDIINTLFLPIDVTRILNIPLAVGRMEDFVAWNYTKTGIFSVRSAYYTEWEDQHGRKLARTTGAASSESNPTWEKIWKLEVSSKVKIFAWHLMHNTIPCNCTLAN